MSFAKSRFVKITASVTSALLFLVFILLLLASNAVLPGEIRSYIKEVLRDTGYEIEIDEISFSLFSGFTGKEIKIFDLLNPANPVLRVKNIAVRPEIISSLINRKVKIREIIVDNSDISLTQEGFDKFAKLTKKETEEGKRKKEKALPVEIERLIIIDARVEVPSRTLIRLKKIKADLRDDGLNKKRTVYFSGLIDLKNNEVKIQGEIKPFWDTLSGELKINLSQLNTRSFSNASLLPKKMSVFLDSKFRILAEIMSQGVINLRPDRSEGKIDTAFSAQIKYDLAYDEITDTALVNSLYFDLDELIHASFA